MKSIIITVFILHSFAFAQESAVLKGVVTDAMSGKPLPAGIVRVLGTSQGTVANDEGMYRLILRRGRYILIYSYIGYVADTASVDLTTNLVRDAVLTPSAILLPEVVVSSEDPAIEIIRRAIANKKKWIDKLSSFEMDAFTRQVLKRDTSIASITESFTKGYWQKGDTLREIITQKRQTENIESSFNFASVGRILNFNDDEIGFLGYTFVGPTATDALDYYDYKLLRTLASHGREIYEIRMIPRRTTAPLFHGIINISSDGYALMGVDVEPNEAFLIPFVKDKSLRYRQQFGLYEDSYWMPADIRIDASVKIGLIGFSIPRIGFTQTSVISDYKINTSIPDSIFQKPKLCVDSIATAAFDSTLWRTTAILPLTVEEERAYETLDSTQTLDVQFGRGSIGIGIGAGAGDAISSARFLDLYFNRVEGFHLGANVELDEIHDQIILRGGAAYGFSDKRAKYTLGATVFLAPDRKFGIGMDVYRRLDYRPDAGYFGPVFNSLTSLLARNDYRDYYESEGGRVFVSGHPTESARFTLSYVSERQTSVRQNTDYSFLAHARTYRPNPAVVNFQRLESVLAEARFGKEEVPLGIIIPNSFEFSCEVGLPDREKNFVRMFTALTLSVPTIGRDFLFPASLRFKVSGGVLIGDLPSQRYFDLESASSNVAPFGVFKAMGVKEFSGTRFFALNVEHNFRSLPFLALGIPFLYENNIEFLIHGGIARSTTYEAAVLSRLVLRTPFPTNSTSQWYYEAGFGFSRIFELLRMDFTWRLSAPYNFRFTVGVANLF